jgi:hypothetical protein
MIIIYDQDKTYIYSSLSDAKEMIIALYGVKLGPEACAKLVKGRSGMVYRRYGGPRIEIVSDADAERIRARETAASMDIVDTQI